MADEAAAAASARFGGSAYKRSTNFQKKSTDRKKRTTPAAAAATTSSSDEAASVSPFSSQSSLNDFASASPSSGVDADGSDRLKESRLIQQLGDAAVPNLPISPNPKSGNGGLGGAAAPATAALHSPSTSLSPNQLREWMSPSALAATTTAKSTKSAIPPTKTGVSVDDDEARNPFRASNGDTRQDGVPSGSESSGNVISTVPSFSEAYTYDIVSSVPPTATTSSSTISITSSQDDDRTVQTSNLIATKGGSASQKQPKSKRATSSTTTSASKTRLATINSATAIDTDATDSNPDEEEEASPPSISAPPSVSLAGAATLSPNTPDAANATTETTTPSRMNGDAVKKTSGTTKTDAAVTSPTKALSDAASAPNAIPVSRPSWEMDDFADGATGKSTRQLFGAAGEMYQNMTDLAPVLSIVESKRKSWFQREMAANQNEWDQYRIWLRRTVEEVSKVEAMIRECQEAFADYAAALDDMASDAYIDEHGELIKKKEKPKFLPMSLGSDKTSKEGTMSKPILDPMTEAYAALKEELDTYLVSLNANLEDATALKNEMIVQTRSLEDKGLSIGSSTVEQAEANIQVAFQALIVAAAEWSEKNREVTEANGDGDEEEAADLQDRWLFESRYRNAAKLGLLTWKEQRRDFQNLYAEIIQLDEVRKTHLQEILLSFLPKRNKLLNKVHAALAQGSTALEGSKLSLKNENDAIEKALTELTSTNLNEATQSQSAEAPDTLMGTNVWESIYVKDRRVVTVKTAKGSWKSGICVTTLDNHFHVFATDDDVNGNEGPSATQGFDSIASRVTANVPEYSVKLSEFDVAVGEAASTGVVEVELSRRGRSKIFRKKEDSFAMKAGQSTASRSASALDWAESLVSLASEKTVDTMAALIPPPLSLRSVVATPTVLQQPPTALTEI